MGDRYVVLALAGARAAWLGALAQWANAGSIAVDLVKCLSIEEVRARLASSRPFSALVVDAALPAVDRDLLDVAASARCPVVGITSTCGPQATLDFAAVIGDGFSADEFVEVLHRTASMVTTAAAQVHAIERSPSAAWRGRVAAVCGPGGTGASTLAIALAQSLGDDPRHSGLVLLADLCLRADQAMLHDARDLSPGLQELVEAHRRGTPPLDVVREHTFLVSARRYRLLLGLRRARAWAALRRRAFEAAFEGLAQAHRIVVCDTDADVEGEREGGSADVQDRNVMARTAVQRADLVFVVGLPTVKGLHSLVRALDDVTGIGVAGDRIVPVVNRAPRGHRTERELSAALGSLLPFPARAPVFVPERAVDGALYDGTRLPDALGAPLARAFHDAPATPAADVAADRYERVTPGSLGAWPDDEAAG